MRKIILLLFLIPSLCFAGLRGSELTVLGDNENSCFIPKVGILPQESYIVAFWQMEEASGNLEDQLGVHTATPVETPLYEQTGKITNCIDFNGTNAHFTVADHSQLSPLLTTGFSISAWINPDVLGADGIVSKCDNPYEWRFIIDGNGKVNFLIWGTGGGYISRITNAGEITVDGGWYHVVATYSGGTTDTAIKIYINRVQKDAVSDGSGTFTAPKDSTSLVRIGAMYGADYFFDGLIDEVIIWQGKELTVDEISWLYSRGSPYRKGYQIK